jgi:hypothetical protein
MREELQELVFRAAHHVQIDSVQDLHDRKNSQVGVDRE